MKRRSVSRGVSVVLLLIGCLLQVSVSKAQDKLLRMEQIIQSSVTGNRFMGSVLVAQNDQVLLDKGYGYANLEWQIPDSPQAKFRLGSITKQFTAACILLLEERGKLKTDDPVKKYMPDAPAAWDKITIYNLLTHTSGIPSFTGFPDYRSTEAQPTTPEKLVARFRDKPLDFQPFRICAAGVSGGEDQWPKLQRLCPGKHLQAAGNERFGIRLQLGDYPPSRIRLRPGSKRTGERGLYRYEHPLFSRRSLLDHA
jgi:hypothetical protein